MKVSGAIPVYCYYPTDAEIDGAGFGSYGDSWDCFCVFDNGDGTYNLSVMQPSGAVLAKTSVAVSSAKGDFEFVLPSKYLL